MYLRNPQLATSKILVNSISCKLQQIINYTRGFSASAFSPVGRKVVFGYDDGTIRIFDCVTKSETLTPKTDVRSIRAVTFSPDGQRFAVKRCLASEARPRPSVNGPGHYLQLLEIETLAVIWDVKTEDLDRIAFSPTGDTIACRERYGYVYLFRAATGQRFHKLSNNELLSGPLEFSPDGLSILVAESDIMFRPSTLKILDAGTGRNLARVNYHSPALERFPSERAIRAGFLPDGQSVWFCSSERVELWDLRTNTSSELIRFPNTNNSMIPMVAASPDGCSFAWCDRYPLAPNILHIYHVNLAAGNVVQRTMVNLKHNAQTIAVSCDGRHIMSVGVNYVYMWDVKVEWKRD